MTPLPLEAKEDVTSVQAMSWVIDNFPKQGRSGEYLVLLMVANAADRYGDNAFPGEIRLADDTGLSTRQVRTNLKKLVLEGWLEREERRISRRHHHRYSLPEMVSGSTTGSPRHDHRKSETRIPEIGPNDGTATRPRTVLEPSLGGVHPSSRPRDRTFEAIVEACGWDLSKLTPTARGRTNRAAKELKAVGASPDEIEAFGIFWRRKYPDAQITPQAISGNWAAFEAGQLYGKGGR